MNQAQQATPEEIAANRVRCMRPHCTKRAFLREWTGWQWCFKHWFESVECHVEGRGLKSWWFNIKNTRIFL